jgi:hypothetical protein
MSTVLQVVVALLIMLEMMNIPAWSDVYKCPNGKGNTIIRDVPCDGTLPTGPSSASMPLPPTPIQPPQPTCSQHDTTVTVTERDLVLVSPLLKALQKVKAATEVGINFRDYGNLVVDAKAATNDVILQLTDQELKAAVYNATDAYADALTVWNISMKGDMFLIIKGGTTSKEEYWQGLALHEKYQFTPDVFNMAVSKKNALRTIWQRAKSYIDCAMTLTQSVR